MIGILKVTFIHVDFFFQIIADLLSPSVGTLSNDNVDVADVTDVHRKSLAFLLKRFDGIGSS